MAEAQKRIEYPQIYDPVDESELLAASPSAILNKPFPTTGLGRLYNLALSKLQMHPVRSGSNEYSISSLLEPQVRVCRETLDYGLVKSDYYMQKFLVKEREVAESVSELKSRDEELMPNLVYVLIGGFTGSILSRRHNILMRTITPVLGAGLAMKYFLPNTWSNVTTQFTRYEKKNLPKLVEAQDNVTEAYEQGTSKVTKAVSDVRKSINEWTGL